LAASACASRSSFSALAAARSGGASRRGDHCENEARKRDGTQPAASQKGGSVPERYRGGDTFSLYTILLLPIF